MSQNMDTTEIILMEVMLRPQQSLWKGLVEIESLIKWEIITFHIFHIYEFILSTFKYFWMTIENNIII